MAAEKMINAILEAKEDKDSLGGIIEIRAVNPPVGLGEPTFDKLDGLIGQAMSASRRSRQSKSAKDSR